MGTRQNAGKRSKVPRLVLDPARTGSQAEDLENKLRHMVVGQDEAIHQIVKTYQTYVAGLSPVGRPVGNFLFLAPTGSGKTRIVEATAASLLNRKYTPEFINRSDNIVVFKSLGIEELRRMVDIELEMAQERIQTASANKPFLLSVTEEARGVPAVGGRRFQISPAH